MEVFREKSNYEGVVSVYEAMKTRGVTPGAKVCHLFINLSQIDSLHLCIFHAPSSHRSRTELTEMREAGD